MLIILVYNLYNYLFLRFNFSLFFLLLSFSSVGQPFRFIHMVPQAYMSSFKSLLKRSTDVMKLSVKSWWCLLTIYLVSFITTEPPRPNSLTSSFPFPVYTSYSQKYPLLLSALTQTFNPRLVGFRGIYCFILLLP